MKTYLIECMETNSFVVEVEAQSEDEARELAHNDIPEEVNNIFEKLEGVVDNFYTEIENAQKKQPTPEWED